MTCYAFKQDGVVPLDCLFECRHPDKCEKPAPKEPVGPRCSYCGATGVHWAKWQGAWKLFDSAGGKREHPHRCPVPNATDDFKGR